MRSLSRPPRHPALHSVVASLWWSERPEAAPLESVLPSGRAQLVVDGDSGVSLVVGPRTEAAVVRSSRCAVGASLGPVGLAVLSSLPPQELVNQAGDADEVLGGQVAASLDGSDVDEAFDQLERRLLRLLRPVGDDDAMVFEAERSVRAGARLDVVASELGVDRRRLVPAFRDRVGVSPKRYQRLMRFQRAVRSMRSPDPAPLTTIAAECGYADQAHMSREVKEFSGRTPGHLRGAPSTAHNHLPADPGDL